MKKLFARLARVPKKYLAIPALLAVLVAGSASSCNGVPDNIAQNDKQANSNFDAQKKNDPIPTLSDSLERANIIEHLKRNNQPDRNRFIYLLTEIGVVYDHFVIKGKVTSTNAQLTPTDNVIDVCSDNSYCAEIVQGATDDGSYGGDEGGIYFFTDTGDEIQWNGLFLISDTPRRIDPNTRMLRLPAGP